MGDLADFVASLPTGAVKFMKMDIEGSEYETIAHMIKKHTLCTNIIPEGTIEVHPWGRTELWKGAKSYAALAAEVKNTTCPHLLGAQATALIQLDDESYFQDVDDNFGDICQ